MEGGSLADINNYC